MTLADPSPSVLETLVERLHARGRLRVWSLVVTLFGDAIVPRGGEAPLALIQDVMGRLGIEPGAVRTALSRLANDHWVERERRGRNSFFRLDERGRHAFDLATRRIYAAGPPTWEGSWTVAIAPTQANGSHDAHLADAGFLKIAPGVHLIPGPAKETLPSDLLVIHGQSAEHPEMLRSLWPCQDVADAYRAFITLYGDHAKALRAGAARNGSVAIAARTMLIHDWRRIVLRDPGLPPALLPQDWPGEEARTLARDIYRALLPASEEWLDGTGLAAPPEKDSLQRRFG